MIEGLFSDLEKKVPLCDLGVYTRNRNFRLFLSSKAGQKNPLKLVEDAHFYGDAYFYGSRITMNNRIFLDALVIPAQSSSNLSIQLVDMDSFIRRNPAPFLHNPYEQNGDARCMARSTEKNVNVVQWTSSTIRPVGAFGDYVQILDGNGCTSPYPLLDEHILRVNQRWRKNSTIRLWRLLRNPSNGRRRIVYEISGCRYCYNIEREHRSNHIFWMVDLEQLVAYQRCHDIDCRGFRSNDFPLPGFVKSTIPSVDDIAKPDFVPQLSTEKLKDELAGVVQLTRITNGLDSEASGSKLEQEQIESEPNLTRLKKIESETNLIRLRRLSAVYENRRVSEELSRTIDPFADCDDEDD